MRSIQSEALEWTMRLAMLSHCFYMIWCSKLLAIGEQYLFSRVSLFLLCNFVEADHSCADICACLCVYVCVLWFPLPAHFRKLFFFNRFNLLSSTILQLCCILGILFAFNVRHYSIMPTLKFPLKLFVQNFW